MADLNTFLKNNKKSIHQLLNHVGAVRELAYVDDDVEIGEGTKIWHFSHVMRGTRIGRDCTLGQNVLVGPNVSVGDNVKIQSNVSVYEGSFWRTTSSAARAASLPTSTARDRHFPPVQMSMEKPSFVEEQPLAPMRRSFAEMS